MSESELLMPMVLSRARGEKKWTGQAPLAGPSCIAEGYRPETVARRLFEEATDQFATRRKTYQNILRFLRHHPEIDFTETLMRRVPKDTMDTVRIQKIPFPILD